ncbi:MAG: TatD family hydrolase [Rikenellaceae bacterium]|jgi:TatD DNase family protein|nr:TatD family hydrolase [Rikenellaceae bacterium]
MILVDTHTHLYDGAFDDDRAAATARAREAGVVAMLLPAIDSSSHAALFDLARSDGGLFAPMMGLHPTSVGELWQRELELVEELLADPPVRFCAVGEVGLDLHWGRDWFAEQTEAFERQISLAVSYDLPLVIHTRDCWPEMLDVLKRRRSEGLRGVMHAFSGSYDDYLAVKRCGDFLFGVGGVVTYKNSLPAGVVPRMSLSDIVLETDSPYLPPMPFRGQRNESGYLTCIADRVAHLLGVSCEEVAVATSSNAGRMFGFAPM